MSSENPELTLSIGTVSRLTGIPVGTLRMWERRYQVVNPARSDANQRSYSRDDVARLGLIKRLVDCGHAIGSIVRLPEEALLERLRLHSEIPLPTIPPSTEKVSVLIQGESLPFLVKTWADQLADLDIVGTHVGEDGFEADVLELKPEVLISECAALRPDRVHWLHDLAQRAGVGRVVLVYGFGEAAAVSQARKLGILALRWPVTAAELVAVCRPQADGVGWQFAEDEGEVPARRFDSETLAILLNIETKVRCECPHHLSDLVFRLSAFEAYSLDCENRNAKDAALHAHLHRTVAQARALVEDALAHLVEVEGIDLDAGRYLPERVEADEGLF
jgi:hypothetical protein